MKTTKRKKIEESLTVREAYARTREMLQGQMDATALRVNDLLANQAMLRRVLGEVDIELHSARVLIADLQRRLTDNKLRRHREAA
jgi:hypothetical protein